MASNYTINMQPGVIYNDIHDNEVVNLTVADGKVTEVEAEEVEAEEVEALLESSQHEQPAVDMRGNGEELCHFVHPSVDSSREWQVHEEIKHLVRRQGLQDICAYLLQMRKENKVLLPQSPSAAYAELVRMGMPSGEGFNEATFRKYYSNK